MPRPAGPPFNESTADIAICSSDDVAFKLHRVILCIASEFFKDMLSLPQPSSGEPGCSGELGGFEGHPLVHVSEQSVVLERLFRLCYPVDDPPLQTIGEVRSTLEAAMKYQMAEAIKITKPFIPVLYTTAKELLASDRTAVHVAEPSRILDILLRLCYPVREPDIEDLHDISIALAAAEKYEMQRASQVLRAALASRREISTDDPVVLYAMACRFDMRDLALDAIGVSGGCFYRLLEYQRRCKSAIRSIFNGTDWIESDVLAQLQDCCSLQAFHATRNPCWYDEYMSRISDEGWPKGETVQDDLLLLSVLESAERVHRANYNPCSTCFNRRGTFLLISFSKCVADTIESLEKKVTLQWITHPQAY
ncbi:hypothetical protein C8T65DRAFT_744306 [Cerioporus squamosus]|nr:hypothetical protein C8T65DRAFT_744306 [Cerioporus squamosus]